MLFDDSNKQQSFKFKRHTHNNLPLISKSTPSPSYIPIRILARRRRKLDILNRIATINDNVLTLSKLNKYKNS